MPDINTLHTTFDIINATIQVSEAAFGPGNGAEKKAHAMDSLKKQIPTVAADLGLPEWLADLLLNDQVLGVLIDFAVYSANRAGTLAASAVQSLEAPKP